MESNPVSPSSDRIRSSRIAAASLAVIGLLIGALFAVLPAAGASEFPPIPTVTAEQHCGPNGLIVSLVLANEGSGTVTFHSEVTIDGLIFTQSFSVSDTPENPVTALFERQVATFTITSTDGPGVAFSLDVPAVDCLADPVASIALVCPSTPAEGPLVEYTYENDSKVPVDFTFTDSYGADIVKSDVKDMAIPATETRAVYEDHAGHAEAFADGVLLASFDTSVDCAPPNHIVVSKTVVGGTGDPAFDFEVVCRPDFDHPTIVVDSFSLRDGESKSVDLPPSNSEAYCSVREVDPGPAWTATQSFDGAAFVPATDENFFPNDTDYTFDVINTAVVDPTTTTTTTTTTTIATPPPTTVGIDAAAVTPSQPTTPASAPAPASSTTLPQTGSDTTSPLLAGLAMLLAGSIVVAATRRSRRRAA